jgi:hypothetical protein
MIQLAHRPSMPTAIERLKADQCIFAQHRSS